MLWVMTVTVSQRTRASTSSHQLSISACRAHGRSVSAARMRIGAMDRKSCPGQA